MLNRLLVSATGMSVLLVLALCSHAQDKPKDPTSRYGMNLKARKAGQDDFLKEVNRFGVEVYTDGNSNDAIYISDTGFVSTVPNKLFKAPADNKAAAPIWLHGLTLTSRPVGEKDWDKGKKIGLELYKDENNGNLVYITDSGRIATVPGKYAGKAEPLKGKPIAPKWSHGMELRVRKAGEKEWTKDTKKHSIEVYKDESSGALVYLTDSGSIAAVGAGMTAKDDKGKEPLFQHGFEVDARKAGEKEFTKDTKTFGVEVFMDESNGNLIYICETGAIAVVPGKFASKTEGKSAGRTFKSAMELQARKADEKDFTNTTKKYGIEVYADSSNNNMVYVTETGELSVVSPKSE
jgi:hypothetical protein